jgi:hypothetical protein
MIDPAALRELGYEVLPVVVEKSVAEAFMAKHGEGWARVLIDYVKKDVVA